MSHKTLTRVGVSILILLGFVAIPVNSQAQGACGGTYVVQQDETVDTLAAACGTTASAIYAANPGISYDLYAGQILTIPEGNCPNCGPNNSYYAPDNSAPNYYNCNPGNCAPNYSNCYQGNCAQSYPNGGTYVVQYGDTFSGIASNFGLSMYDLWTVNQNLGDYNLLYPGQVLNIPQTSGIAATPQPYYYGYQSAPPYYGNQPYPYGYQSAPPYYGNQPYPYGYQSAPPYYGNQSYPYGYQSAPPYYGSYPPPYYYGYATTPTPTPTPIFYGTVPAGAPRANITLSNVANTQVFVSLEGTARDGASIVREYQVYGTDTEEVPAGYYNYTAWVGGQKFSGSINLPGGSRHTLTFHGHEVDAQ